MAASDMKKTKAELVDELEKLRRRLTRTENQLKKLIEAEAGPPKDAKSRGSGKALDEESINLRELATHMTDVFWLVSPDWNKIHYISPAYETVWGRSLASLYENPLSWMDSVLEEDRKRIEKEIEEKVTGDRETTDFTDYRITRPDGSVRWIRSKVFPILDKNNKPVRMAGVARDVTESKKAERALIESERRFRDTLENIHLVAVGLDVEGRVDFINEYLLDLLGWDREEVLGKDWFENFLPPDVREEVKAIFDNSIIDGGIPVHYENEIVTRDGERRLVRWNNTMLRDSAGKAAGAIGIGEDITERERALNELKAKKEQVDNFFLSSLDLLAIANTDGYFVRLNPEWERTLGYDLSELEGIRFLDLVHPDDLQPTLDAISELSDQKVLLNFTNRYRCKNGSYRWIEWRSYPVGKTIYASARDITHTKEMEAAIIKERDQARMYFNMAQVMLMALGNEGRISQINRRGAEVLELEEDEAIGKNWFDNFIPEDERAEVKKVFKMLMNGEMEPVECYENRIVTANGNIKTIAWRNTVMRNRDGDIVGTFSSGEDISLKKQLEEERIRASKLESIGILAGGIAHDFNNILSGVLGNVSLARLDWQRGEDITGSLVGAEKAALRAKDLTRQLLTFSKGGAPVKTLASLKDIVEESTNLILRGSNVACEVDYVGELPALEVDVGQTVQVLNNIIINALQAMPGGGVVKILAKPVSKEEVEAHMLEPGQYVRLDIADDGAGINEEDLERIFDPYFTTKRTGSGLGLATAYSIVKQHGGEIMVDSNPGKGTVFSVYLPAREGASPESEESAEKVEQGRGRVLLVDDEAMVRDVAMKMLCRLGYEVETVEEGAKGVRAYTDAMESQCPFDAVIMDLTIPGGMGGKDAIKKLKEVDPKVKAIVSSGYSNDPVLANFRDYGFKGVVVKPFQVNELGKVIKKVIED